MSDIINFEIRLIQSEDVNKHLVQQVNMLLFQLWDGSRSQTAAGLKKYVSQDHIYQYGAFLGNKLVGIATLVVVERIELSGGQLEGVVVSEEYRRRGIGKALSKMAIEKGDELGLLHIELTSRPSRKPAHKLYKGLGFKMRETAVYRLEY